MEKVKIEKFVKDFLDAPDAESKDKIIENVIVKKYAPITIKNAIAVSIINQNYIKNGELRANSVALYLTHMVGILEIYTCLEIPKKDAHLAYDMLQEHGLFDILIRKIGDDIKEYDRIFQMCRDDFATNNYKPHILCQRYADKLLSFLGNFMKELSKAK